MQLQQPVNQKPSLVYLALSFIKLGATAFGGPAMVAYIRKMAVERNKWLDEDCFRNGVALCQTIPGATAMQVSAYVGLRTRGIPGAIVSFVSFGVPAFVLMMVLSALYVQTHNLPMVVSAFTGLKAIIVAIIANATISFARTSLKSWKDIIVVIIIAGLFWFRIHPFIVILLSALLGIALHRKRPFNITKIHTTDKIYSARFFAIVLPVIAVGFFVLFFIQHRLFELAALMFRIDLFAFGGGFSSLPLMFHEIVNARSWMDSSTFLNGIALGQITPGPIVITATFIGYLMYGPLGGLVATLSIFSPSFIMLVGMAPYFDRLRNSAWFNKVITGILISFVGLLLTMTVRFAIDVHWDIPRILLTAAAFAALLSKKVDILWVVLAGTIISILVL